MKAVFERHGQGSRLDNLDEGKTYSLVAFLTPFEKELDRLQGDKYPTMPFALISYTTLLRRHCAPKPGDSPMILKVKERARFCLETEVQISDDHKLATFLIQEFTPHS